MVPRFYSTKTWKASLCTPSTYFYRIQSSAIPRRRSFHTTTQQNRHRVVITGIGAVTPLGLSFVDSWQALLQNHSGVTSLADALREQYDDKNAAELQSELEIVQKFPCQVAAPVKNFQANQYSPRTTARFTQLALQATKEALQQAQLIPPTDVTSSSDNDWFGIQTEQTHNDQLYVQRRQRAGVCIASGMSSVREIVQASNVLQTQGYRKLTPHFVPKILTNIPSGRIAIEFGNLQGPNLAPSTACAASGHAIGDAYRILSNVQNTTVDLMIAGGTEAAIDPLSIAGFARLRALSTHFNETPEKASRPFDVDRDGFVLGEGATVLILERLEHALQRHANEKSGKPPILAEVVGYSATGDGHHLTAPDPSGRGIVRCMNNAIADAAYTNSKSRKGDLDVPYSEDEWFQRVRDHIQYVNAHATSTPKGDEIEVAAIETVFSGTSSPSSNPVLVSSTKGATGHLLGAAGAIEAAFTIQAVHEQKVPPTLNLDNPVSSSTESPTMGQRAVHLVQNKAEPLHDEDESVPSMVMSNSFGFGGTNATLIFQRYRG